MTPIPFTKMHGLGNDYVYIDGFAHQVDDPNELAQCVSDRHRGVGADGLIIVLPPSPGVDAHVRMRMFNADGSEGEMCGNGIRCVCKFAVDRGLAHAHPLRVQTGRGVRSLEWWPGDHGVESVRVDMGEPILRCAQIPAVIPGIDGASTVVADARVGGALRAAAGDPAWGAIESTATLVSLGNPHLVLWCPEPDRVDLTVLGLALEHHAMFPNRINVHVAHAESRRRIRVRTWERGSGVTQACGTGACAVAVAGELEGRTDANICVHVPGGELTVEWSGAGHSVFMTGPAVTVFEGVWHANLAPVERTR